MLDQQLQGLSSKDQFTELGRRLTERRNNGRVNIRSVIRVAEWDGLEFPQAAAFHEVETRDLATTGISYFCPVPPKSKTVLVMLGAEKTPLFVVGRVAYFHECKWSRASQWFVGCEFTDRVAPVVRPNA